MSAKSWILQKNKFQDIRISSKIALLMTWSAMGEMFTAVKLDNFFDSIGGKDNDSLLFLAFLTTISIEIAFSPCYANKGCTWPLIFCNI